MLYNCSMPATLIATKLNIPPPRAKTVLRPRLVERLQTGLLAGCRLTLISAPAGFGKTSLISAWISMLKADSPPRVGNTTRVAWVSLDDGDNDPVGFVLYVIAALQTLWPEFGAGVSVARIDPEEFQASFMKWGKALHQITQGQVIGIDCKQRRGSHDQSKRKRAIYMVSAWAA
jgi:LuxR family maltose regulon positive regulatory protein